MRRIGLGLLLVGALVGAAQAQSPYAGSFGGSSLVIGTTPITGGATTQVLFNLAGKVTSDGGFTYAGANGAITAQGTIGTVGTVSAGSGTAQMVSNGMFLGAAVLSQTQKPTASAGVCVGGTTTGGAESGTFVAPTCGGTTLTLTFAAGLVNNGWVCVLTDLTTNTNTLKQNATLSTTTANFTATTTNADVISYHCGGF